MTASKEAREIATRWGLTPDQVQTFVDAYGAAAEQYIKAAVAIGARTNREFLERTFRE